MKNSKMIIFTLAIALIAMGAGYAAWTQSFEVKAQVDTGELKVIVSDFGYSTRVDSIEILDKDDKAIDSMIHKINDELTVFTTNSDGSVSFNPRNGNDFEYFDIEMTKSAEEDAVLLNVYAAYPGLKVNSKVEMLNVGTIPAILNTENPMVFNGKDELSRYLFLNDYVTFVVTPGQDVLDGKRIVPQDIASIRSIEMVISSSMPGEVDISGRKYQTEGQNLSYEMKFNITQGTM